MSEKTIREWFEELPEGVKDKALDNCVNPDDKADTLSEALSKDHWSRFMGAVNDQSSGGERTSDEPTDDRPFNCFRNSFNPDHAPQDRPEQPAITMTFPVPEYEEEARTALNAGKVLAAIQGFDRELRLVAKHGEGEQQEHAELWRAKLHQHFNERGLSIWD